MHKDNKSYARFYIELSAKCMNLMGKYSILFESTFFGDLSIRRILPDLLNPKPDLRRVSEDGLTAADETCETAL